MIYAFAADAVVLVHFAFILYVIFGGILVYWWRWTVWLHVPTALYGVAIEWIGWTCPLTPLERQFRGLAGEAGYEGGFVGHYLLPIIYPEGLTPDIQLVLGSIVVGVNGVVYAIVWSAGQPSDD